MIKLYCFHSPMVSSVGFQRAVWKYENGLCQKMEKNETEELPWEVLCGSGASVLWLDAASTRLLAMRDISSSSEDGTGWRLSFLIEVDKQDQTILPGLLAAILKDKNTFCYHFASLFSVSYEGGEHYVLNSDGFIRFIEQLRGENLSQALEQIPSVVLRERIRKSMPTGFQLTPGKLHLLVPSVTEEYFYRYSGLKLKDKSAVCIDLNTWNALLAHEITEKWTEVPAKSADTLSQGVDEEVRNALLLLTAVVVVGGLIWSFRKRR